jgi:hypothetical protein
MKIKCLQTLAIYIWLEPTRQALFEIRNPISNLDPKLPKLLAEVWDGSNSSDNSGEQLLLIHVSLAESKGTPARVSPRASYQCF